MKTRKQTDDGVEEHVVFPSCRQNVSGVLHLPVLRKGRVPGVIFLHSFTGNKQGPHRIFVDTARALQGIGAVGLRFDFRGCGDSAGEFSRMTPAGQVKDIEAALRYLRRRPEVDPRCIALVGFSLGALVAVPVLAADRRLAAGVLWNPIAFPEDVWGGRMDEKQLEEMGVVDLEGWAVGRGFFEDVLARKPLADIGRCRAPVLIVQCAKDPVVTPRHADAYEAAVRKGGGTVDKVVVPDGDHYFSSLAWQTQMMAFTVTWLRYQWGM